MSLIAPSTRPKPYKNKFAYKLEFILKFSYSKLNFDINSNCGWYFNSS